MNWIIKKFEDLNCKELYKILALRNEVFIVEQKCAYQDCDGKDIFAHHLFLEDEGEIAAYLRIIEKGISFGEVSLGRLLVRSRYRRKGIAREIMEKAIKFVEEELKEYEIRISAQTYLINFYRSLGFRKVSEVYLEDEIPHIEMLYSRK